MLHEKWLCKVCLNSEVLCALFAPDLFAYLMLPFRISKVPEIAVLIGPTIKLMQFLLSIGHRRLKTLTTINIIIIIVVVVVNIIFQ